ncbi:MAG: protein-L-isoaspartate(D-aspartate) O-methyltransferase [Chloroflexi bacterium]|nr:MAG: protein-L-isoaspartate(D-aspartate) O-methyltransferase [Chloroflexota bacterium]
MVDEQLRGRGITDARVLQAMAEIPREDFVPDDLKRAAYEDSALSIGHGQTISQPLVVASMTQALALSGDENVLEIGTGSGYQAAILARLCRHVVTVEVVPQLAEAAAARLRRLGLANLEVAVGDGWNGWPPAAPYEGVLVACAAPALPAPLLEQMTPAGRLVIPIGPEGGDQVLQLVRKDGRASDLFPVRFVPLRRGRSGGG